MADVDFTTMLCEPELVMITARTVLFAYINLGINNIYLTNFMVLMLCLSGIYLRYNVFCSLRIMVKSTSRHLFYYGELLFKELYFPNMKYFESMISRLFSFLHYQYFFKIVKIMKVLSVLITKYIICTNFLVSNTINILI